MPKNAKSIRVVVADDHPVVRAGVCHELQAAGIQVVGEAGDGETALALVENLHPEVLILDIEMPNMNGLEVIKRIGGRQAALSIIVLSAYDHNGYVEGVLELGAAGYLLKDEALENIVSAVRAALADRAWLSPRIAKKVLNRLGRKTLAMAELSLRETEVLQMIARGYTNAQIAEALHISEGTVRNHINSIFSKTSLHSRADVVVWAWEHGLVNKV